MVDECIIVRSRLKELSGDFNVSKDFIKKLDTLTKEVIDKAKERSLMNGRKTLMKQDL